MNFRYKTALCAAVLLCATEAEAANFLVVDIAAQGVGRGSTGSRSTPGPIQSYTFSNFYASLAYNLEGPNAPRVIGNTLSVVGAFSTPVVTGLFSNSGFNFEANMPLQFFTTYKLSGAACYANASPTTITTGSPGIDPSCSPLSISFSDGFALSALDFTGTLTGISFRVVEADTLPGVVFAIPEPATWALMLTGFALTGYALRRRRARVAFA